VEQEVQDLELPVADAQEDNESDRSAGQNNNLNSNNNVNLQVEDQNAIPLDALSVVGSMNLNHIPANQPHSAVEDGPVD